METIALRLNPQQDLKVELEAFAKKYAIEAACMVTCVGSLTHAVLRLANQSDGTVYEGRFEIISLAGTLSRHGIHCHMAIADSTGCTFGGHLLKGCLIFTTAELIIGILPNLRFMREFDETTGYPELKIETL
jgi:predicted DNA-binding protein with PD1-like motif